MEIYRSLSGAIQFLNVCRQERGRKVILDYFLVVVGLSIKVQVSDVPVQQKVNSSHQRWQPRIVSCLEVSPTSRQEQREKECIEIVQ